MNKKSILINLFIAVFSLLIGMAICDNIQSDRYEQYIQLNKKMYEGTYWSRAYNNLRLASKLRDGDTQGAINLHEKYIENDIETFMNFGRPLNEHELKTLEEARTYYSQDCEEQCLFGIESYIKQDITKP